MSLSKSKREVEDDYRDNLFTLLDEHFSLLPMALIYFGHNDVRNLSLERDKKYFLNSHFGQVGEERRTRAKFEVYRSKKDDVWIRNLSKLRWEEQEINPEYKKDEKKLERHIQLIDYKEEEKYEHGKDFIFWLPKAEDPRHGECNWRRETWANAKVSSIVMKHESKYTKESLEKHNELAQEVFSNHVILEKTALLSKLGGGRFLTHRGINVATNNTICSLLCKHGKVTFGNEIRGRAGNDENRKRFQQILNINAMKNVEVAFGSNFKPMDVDYLNNFNGNGFVLSNRYVRNEDRLEFVHYLAANAGKKIKSLTVRVVIRSRKTLKAFVHLLRSVTNCEELNLQIVVLKIFQGCLNAKSFRLPSVKTLQIRGYKIVHLYGDISEGFPDFLKCFPNVQNLTYDFGHSTKFMAEYRPQFSGLGHLFPQFPIWPNLRYFSFRLSPNEELNTALLNEFECMPKYQWGKIARFEILRADNLVEISSALERCCKELKSLKISGTHYKTEEHSILHLPELPKVVDFELDLNVTPRLPKVFAAKTLKFVETLRFRVRGGYQEEKETLNLAHEKYKPKNMLLSFLPVDEDGASDFPRNGNLKNVEIEVAPRFVIKEDVTWPTELKNNASICFPNAKIVFKMPPLAWNKGMEYYFDENDLLRIRMINRTHMLAALVPLYDDEYCASTFSQNKSLWNSKLVEIQVVPRIAIKNGITWPTELKKNVRIISPNTELAFKMPPVECYEKIEYYFDKNDFLQIRMIDRMSDLEILSYYYNTNFKKNV